MPEQTNPIKWAKVIDHTRCIGCHACTTACKSENLVPLSVTRTYVKHVDVGIFPQVRRVHQVTRCNQCAHAPCVVACPTTAMFKRADGIVDFDKSICIGCKACMAACPYDAIFINPEDHSAEKCNFCAHRIDMGLEPACVVVCPTQAILVGDMNDTDSYVAQIINREAVTVRRPENAHSIPWDWRVSLYTWTKGIAAGVYLVASLLVLFGFLTEENWLWLWATPIVSGGFLAVTGGLLLWDLEHPELFYLIFTRPQWRSWLVKGAFIIAGYTLVLALHFLGSWLGSRSLQRWLMIPGVPLSGLTAIYTAYLFAQAKARDMWQNPLLPPHLFVQALLLGSAVLSLLVVFHRVTVVSDEISGLIGFIRKDFLALLWILAASSLLHLLLICGEGSLTHPTAHARLAIWEMVRGRYRSDFWIGTLLSLVGGLVPWLAIFGVMNISVGVAGAPMALIGLMLYENAYVQAGQSVPLA